MYVFIQARTCTTSPLYSESCNFFSICGSYGDAKKILRRKTNLKLRSLNFFRKLFFSENCKRILNIRKTPFKCFLTMPKHGEVIEHKVDKLELALGNNVELFWGLRFQM